MSVSGNSESLDIQSGDCAILMMLINNMKQLEECVERAGRMLEELRKMGRGEEELADAETILEELT